MVPDAPRELEQGLGLLFGALGIFLASPLTVSVMVFIQLLYVQDILGDSMRAFGETWPFWSPAMVIDSLGHIRQCEIHAKSAFCFGPTTKILVCSLHEYISKEIDGTI
ncbi:MAG: hypothetical protein GF401_08885 [Chitinivibrionales bacterium]|nr:hypothetical protein [Chitinivibrionales bacterium]